MRSAFAVAIVLLCARPPVAGAADQAADAEAEMARADVFMQQRNWQAAIAHYNAARILAPDRPGPYRGLGMAYYAAGQCADAVPVLEEYVRRKARDPWPQALAALSDCKQKLEGGHEREHASVRITSEPAGAAVRLDDEEGAVAGYTPFESSSVQPGTHRVFLSRPDYRPAVGELRVEPNVQATLHVTLQPLRLDAATMRHAEEERLKRERELGEYDQSQAEALNVENEIRVRIERQRLSISGSGTDYTFHDVNGVITENEFVRRYKKVTAQGDLNFALKMRNKTVIAVWASIGLAGVGLLAYGAATYTRHCKAPDDNANSDCNGGGMVDPNKTTTDDLSQKLLISGAAIQVGSSVLYLTYGGLRPDGVPTQHYIAEFDARLAVDRYNRALERKVRAELRGHAEATTGTNPLAPFTTASGVQIVPCFGFGGIGLSGRF